MARTLALLLAFLSVSFSSKVNVRKWQWGKSTIAAAAVGAILGGMAPTIPYCLQPVFADARLNAPTAAGTRVNSDAESLLRYGLPIDNKEVRDLQASIENIKANIKARRIEFAKNDANSAKGQLLKNGDKMVAAAPANHRDLARASLQRMQDALVPLQVALSSETAAGTGSLQQRSAYDEGFSKQDLLARELSVFEQLLVPDDFCREIPAEYRGLPALQGRAEVEMVIKKAEPGQQFNVDGVNYDEVRLRMVIDGYNAPLTGGNFVDLVNRGFYNKKPITRSDGFVVQTGDADPAGTVHGFVPPGRTEERTIPLEIALRGDKQLLYGSTSEDDSRGAEAAVLPFQSYGALGMARSEYEADSASSQFFWLLFESDLTPAGKNMLDGRYACFGYTVKDADLLKDVKEGDVVDSARVVRGLDHLEVVK